MGKKGVLENNCKTVPSTCFVDCTFAATSHRRPRTRPVPARDARHGSRTLSPEQNNTQVDDSHYAEGVEYLGDQGFAEVRTTRARIIEFPPGG